MTNLTKQLLQTVEQSLAGHTQILLALSGGLDSRVLLHLLQRWRTHLSGRSVRAIYIHHGLSAQADAWAIFCQRCCEDAEITYECLPIQVIRRPRESLEATARTARYQALAQRVTYEEVIVTAHHQDDQCETLLLALKRGSGPAGLAAMPAAQPFAGSQLCRPLLTVSRGYLHTYAQQHQLTWIEDPSNQLLQFDRNFLRQQILPNLSVRWPQFTATVARSARLCGEQEQLLDELLLPRLVSLTDTQGSLAIGPLLTESVLKRQALLRRWCHRVGAPTPNHQQLTQLWDRVALSRRDANPQLTINGWQVRRYRQRLYWIAPMAILPAQWVWQDWQQSITLPGELGRVGWHRVEPDKSASETMHSDWVRLPEPDQRVTWRFGISGRFRVLGRGQRSLKKLYQERGVPPWLRSRLPALYYDEQLIAIPGIAVTEAGAAKPNLPTGQLMWQPIGVVTWP